MKEKIMKEMEFDDAIWFRIGCACSDPDHDLNLLFEEDGPFYSITLAAKMNMEPSIHDHTWKYYWKVFVWRVKTAAAVLFKGKAEYRNEFMLDKTNVRAFKYAINEAEKKLKADK